MPFPDHQYHESPEEIDKIRRRAEIRNKLRMEFNRVYYNPYKCASQVEILDPAVQRFTAMRATYYQYWKPTWKGFLAFASCTFVPIWAFGYYLNYSHREFDKKCRTGEIRVEQRQVKIV